MGSGRVGMIGGMLSERRGEERIWDEIDCL